MSNQTQWKYLCWTWEINIKINLAFSIFWYMVVIKNRNFNLRGTWVWILTLILPRWVILGKLFNFYGFMWISPPVNGNDDTYMTATSQNTDQLVRLRQQSFREDRPCPGVGSWRAPTMPTLTALVPRFEEDKGKGFCRRRAWQPEKQRWGGHLRNLGQNSSLPTMEYFSVLTISLAIWLCNHIMQSWCED